MCCFQAKSNIHPDERADGVVVSFFMSSKRQETALNIHPDGRADENKVRPYSSPSYVLFPDLVNAPPNGFCVYNFLNFSIKQRGVCPFVSHLASQKPPHR